MSREDVIHGRPPPHDRVAEDVVPVDLDGTAEPAGPFEPDRAAGPAGAGAAGAGAAGAGARHGHRVPLSAVVAAALLGAAVGAGVVGSGDAARREVDAEQASALDVTSSGGRGYLAALGDAEGAQERRYVLRLRNAGPRAVTVLQGSIEGEPVPVVPPESGVLAPGVVSQVVLRAGGCTSTSTGGTPMLGTAVVVLTADGRTHRVAVDDSLNGLCNGGGPGSPQDLPSGTTTPFCGGLAPADGEATTGYVGRSEIDALQRTTTAGLHARVAERDGQCLVGASARVPDRLSFTVDDGVVVAVRLG